MSLPDTAALQALILVAQTGSISATAQLMGRTHSAVSRKIKGLEARLGFRLTQPAGRGIALTPRAIAYADEIAPLLTAIDQAGRSGSMVDGTLTVSVAPGFAASWLIHRLQAFSGLHPGIHLRLTTPRGYGDISDPADIYITFARPSQMPADARRLFDVGFFPVLAPPLLDHIDPRSPDSLAGLPILHLDSPEDWIAWIAAASGSATSVENGHVFSDMQLMLAAAEAGQGVALGDRMTAGPAIERGALVAPFKTHLSSGRSYFLMQAHTAPAAGQAFSDWLLTELKDDQALLRSATGAFSSRSKSNGA